MKTWIINESSQYVTDKSFQLTTDKLRQFGIVFETTNMMEATGEPQYENYPFVVSAVIVLDKPSKKFAKEAGLGNSVSKLGAIAQCVSYMGGVPVDHILQDEMKSSNESGIGSNFDLIANQFNATEATVNVQTSQFGTVAAQRGKLSQFKSLHFATEKAAQKYIDYLILNRLFALSMLVGFILDRPINMVGHNGWSQIETMATGK